jgi:hypothetical protein
MALNPFFLQGSPSEQNLIQDLINEQLRMYGVEVYYMPRKYVSEKTVIREVIESEFNESHPIEAYLENFEGYGDQTTILSKFGIQSTQEITLTISKERYENYIEPLIAGKDNIKLSSRPKEGDLIYFPLGDRLFEIKFVEHEKPFYQLQKGYVYTLKCELFRYENELIDTGIDDIDDAIQGTLGDSDGELLGGDAMTTTLKLVGVGTTATASLGYVVDGGIRQISVTNRGGGYTYNPRVAISSSPGVTGIATAERISGIVACELNANPVAESIQKVFLTNPGSGYTVAPSVRFIGDGVGAAATASIGNGVIGIVTITGGGSGYTTATAPAVTFSGVSTVSAAATVRVSSAGTISHIYITNAGLGYTEPPTITLAAPNQTGVGTFQKNEIVTGSSSGTTARVLNWVASTGSLEIYRADGDFVVGEQIVGAASSASYKLSSSSFPETGFMANEEIEGEADAIIDFTERNPFGMP